MASRINRLSAYLLVTGLAMGCARSGELVRSITYPPSIRYLSDQEVRTAMGRLAKDVVDLDALIHESPEVRTANNDELLAILRSMRSTASSMTSGGDTNHPRIDRYLPKMIDDIDRAIGAAENRSANYYYAGTVIGACEYCHAPKHDRIHRDSVPEMPTGA
jgi:hypothetical protein